MTRPVAVTRKLLDSLQVPEVSPGSVSRPLVPTPSPAEYREQAHVYDSLDKWRDAGLVLTKESDGLAWRFGDWWNAGERFGERVDVVRSPDWPGPSYGTIRVYASVAAAFTVLTRVNNLTFSHHRALLTAPEAERAGLLTWAVTQERVGGAPASVSELRRECKRRAEPAPAPASPDEEEKALAHRRRIAEAAKRTMAACASLRPYLRSVLRTDEDFETFGRAFGRELNR